MSKSTISAFKLLEIFPDEETARKYLESRLWPNGVRCPSCKSGDRITDRKRGGFYRCNACQEDFTVRTGTILGRSHVPLHKWLYAMYLLVTARKGISSMQLAKEIGITQKSAWFVLQRLREACGDDLLSLCGVVEVDETYLGGKEGNRHFRKRLNLGSGPVGKTVIVALRERGGRTKAFPAIGTGQMTLENTVSQNVEKGATVHTDEYRAYKSLRQLYTHQTVNHKMGEYSRRGISTHSVESVFAVLKRGLHGVDHPASKKHIGRYVNEFTGRLNDGQAQRHTLERLDSFVDAVTNRRITYRELTT